MELEPLRNRRTRLQVNPGGRPVRTHTRRFRVRSNAVLDTSEVLARLPWLAYEPHEFDSAAVLRSVDVDEEQTRKAGEGTFFTYLITTEWSTEMPEQRDEDPLNDPPEVGWDGVEEVVAIYQDRDGKAVLNTAKDYFFDPSLEDSVIHPILTITRNQQSFDAAFVFAYAGTINSTAFYGAPAGRLKMLKPVAKRLFANGDVYWQVTYQFEYKHDGWQPKVLNQGLRYLDTSGAEPVRADIKDEHGRPIRDPVPLDAAGQPIPPENLPDDAHYIEPLVKREQDFNDLGL